MTEDKKITEICPNSVFGGAAELFSIQCGLGHTKGSEDFKTEYSKQLKAPDRSSYTTGCSYDLPQQTAEF